MIVVTDDCGAARRCGGCARSCCEDARQVVGIFGVMARRADRDGRIWLIATAGLDARRLGAVVGLLVVPLQAAAWLVRGLLFQYSELDHAVPPTRRSTAGSPSARGPRAPSLRGTQPHDQLRPVSLAGGHAMRESAIRQMGTVLAQARDMISFAPGYPAEDAFPWQAFARDRRELLGGADGRCCSTGRRAATGRCVDAMRRR